MKKIILALIVSFSVFAAGAQSTTKTKSKKSKKATTAQKSQAKQKAELARIKLETDKKIAEFRTSSFLTDSMRIDSERVARENFELERKAYLEGRYREIDSTNLATWKRFSEEKEQWSRSEQRLDAINKAANLGTYESRQVKMINQRYSDKAGSVKSNSEITEQEKQQQLISLNSERRSKIKAVVGKSKEKKVEKERKDLAKKYGEDADARWINEVDGFATKD